MAAKQRIHFIATGGTIDASYFPPRETAVPNAASAVPDFIRDVIKPHFAASFETLFLKDSRDITAAMLRKLAAAIREAPAPAIIVTHGTSMMARTAEYLSAQLKGGDKVVVLTGAMVPFRDIVRSDGGFNLGYAVAACGILEPGVYIAMNGKVFKAGEARKDERAARFEAVKSS